MKKLVPYIITALVSVSAGTLTIHASETESADARIEMSTQQPVIRVKGHVIEISNPGDDARQVIIYSLTGQVVKSLNAESGVTTIELPAGYYIVKCDSCSKRVVIR